MLCKASGYRGLTPHLSKSPEKDNISFGKNPSPWFSRRRALRLGFYGNGRLRLLFRFQGNGGLVGPRRPRTIGLRTVGLRTIDLRKIGLGGCGTVRQRRLVLRRGGELVGPLDRREDLRGKNQLFVC